MKVVHFDDGDFEWALPPWDIERPLRDRSVSLDDWFNVLAESWAANKSLAGGSAGVFLIHANGQFTGLVNRQDLQGVEILKHIRLTDLPGDMRTWHAIVYSFEPLEHILRRKPGNLILSSPGVTFLRLPDCLELESAVRIVHETKQERPTLQDLAQKPFHRAILDRTFRPFVACDYAPPDSDHAISNWWGARQVVLGLDKFEHAQNVTLLPVTTASALRSLAIKEAMFLAPDAIPGQKMTADERKRVKEELKRVRRYFSNIPAPPKIVYVDDEMDKGWDQAVYRALTGTSMPPKGVSWFHTSMGQLAASSNKEDEWKLLAEMVLAENPELILTDLRLLGANEARTPVKETSGAKLIKFLRERTPGVPIILLTASNKAWTFQEAFQLGVDAYWMKEGIGDHASPSRSIENTAEFLRLIGNLLGPDYQLLRKIQEMIERFEGNWDKIGDEPWWKRMTWPDPAPNDSFAVAPISITDLTEPTVQASTFFLLRNVVRSYREYLRLFQLCYGASALYGNQLLTTTNFWLQSIVVHVGHVIECIHRFDQLRSQNQPGQEDFARAGTMGAYFDKDRRRLQKMRRDWFGQGLYDVRNIAAHFDPAAPLITKDNLRSLLAALFAWLSVTPKRDENPANCRSGSTRRTTKWPKATDLFVGPDRHDDLVDVYSDLYGSDDLNLPTRQPYARKTTQNIATQVSTHTSVSRSLTCGD
jgi:CheY-like chemotaxis protein